MMEEKGFVLMDMVIASAIIIVGMLTILKGYSGIMDYTARNTVYNQTLYVAQQTLEKLKQIDGKAETKDDFKLRLKNDFKETENADIFYLEEVQGDETYHVKVELIDTEQMDIPNKLVACHVEVIPAKKDQKKVEIIGYYYLKKGGNPGG